MDEGEITRGAEGAGLGQGKMKITTEADYATHLAELERLLKLNPKATTRSGVKLLRLGEAVADWEETNTPTPARKPRKVLSLAQAEWGGQP